MILINAQNLNNPIMPAFIPLTVEVQEDGVAEGQVNTLNFTDGVDVSVSGATAAVKVADSYAPLLPKTGTGTATGAVVGELDGNTLHVEQGGIMLLGINPTAGSESVALKAFNTTDDNNSGYFSGNTTNTTADANVVADFNDGVKRASIVAAADASSSSITHTADTHTFVAGGNNYIELDGVGFNSRIRAEDGTASSQLIVTGDLVGNNVKFNLNSNDGSNDVSILGDAQANSITHTADNHIFNGPLQLNGSTSGDVDIQSDALGNAPNGTTLSGTGYIGATMFSRLTSNHTMSDVNTVQPVFSSGQDVWTLQGATTYRFKGQYYLTHGAVSHSVGMSFELGGGASVTNINYHVLAWVTAAGTVTATQATTLVNVATNVAINFAGANAQEVITFEGWLTMNAGGTVTPSITFSAAPGGAPVSVAYLTWIEFTPIATNTATSLGNVA